MPILWTSSMSVGNKIVDSDHQKLFKLINIVEEELNSEKKENIENALRELENYTEEHFTREEALMKLGSYSGHFQHFKKHHNLKNQLKIIKKDILNDLNNPKNYDNLIEVLRKWLLDHVLVEDLKMRPYYKKLI
ncbi:MAG: hypothetical protein D8M58_13750 [Calditrichaeota bacterium]|nr:MAG: hypothetical protein DWQ03_14990 [Calditrichota bacterium]MBL1206464.1 hypothetical protein [Calditrichota bacterium]NOG46291.1 bacteriohemerythrin [Calditrichota bacterium]